MQVLVVIIEKDGENYIGRCPNLLGVRITGKTRDEAETAILEVIETRLNELYAQHSNRKVTVARGNFEETIECVYKYRESDANNWRSSDKCEKPAQKEGLCWQHWKKIYSHAVGTKTNLDGCPLCGETDQDILRRWESICPFKAENPNWEELLEEKKKAQQTARVVEQREERLKKHEKYLRCTATLKNGNQCSSLADSGIFCGRHSELSYKKSLHEGNFRSEVQNESARNYFRNRNRWK
jgi:predicted RNase H-like HicB family nuclease